MSSRLALLLASLTLTACQQGKVDHVLVLQDSKSATVEAALGVMAKHGVAADVARPLLVAVSEKGEGIVVQGTKDACERIKASFEAIGMQSIVRPITAEDRKGPPSEVRDTVAPQHQSPERGPSTPAQSSRRSEPSQPGIIILTATFTVTQYLNSDVVELESIKELEQLMASDEGVLLAFHGTTCAHCRAMAPDYKQARRRTASAALEPSPPRDDSLASLGGVDSFSPLLPLRWPRRSKAASRSPQST